METAGKYGDRIKLELAVLAIPSPQMTAWNIWQIVSRLSPQVNSARHDNPPNLSKTLVFMDSIYGPQLNLLSISTPNSLLTFALLIIPLSPKSSPPLQLSFWRRVRWTS